MSNNIINETNAFIKQTLIDPRDEAKRPSKAKHEEGTQRNAKLDEFAKISCTGEPAPVYPVGLGCTGAIAPEQYAVLVPTIKWHRMYRWCQDDAPVQAPCHALESMSSSLGEVLQYRLNRWCTGGSTGVMPWQLQERRVAPVAPVTRHRSIR